MIKKTDLLDELTPFGKTVFGCRIQSAASAYGLEEPFAQFWTQGERAALCKLDDVIILDAADGADFDELRDFIRMTGAKRLVCTSDTAQRLDFPTVLLGEIMVCHNQIKPNPQAAFELNPSLREVYSMLCECETDTFVPPEFEPFYMDLSHRIRHGAAIVAGIRKDELLVSCAVCIAQTEDKAIISSVATIPAQREKGFGRAVLEALFSQLKQENVYIFRAPNENEDFYRSLGFTPIGQFAELSL